MQALIFGAGKIARGFIGHLLHSNGIPFAFVERDLKLVDLINTRREYHVEVMGNSSHSVKVTNASAIPLSDHETVARAWTEAAISFTCVGGKNLEDLGSHMAGILEKRQNLKNVPTNVITCENWKEPGALLKTKVISQIAPETADDVLRNVGFSEAVVMRSAVEAKAEQLLGDPLLVNVQDYWELPVDESKIIGRPVSIVGIKYISDFSGFLERKFYTYNAANATAAYLGFHQGYRSIYEAANDPVIAEAIRGVYSETGAALTAKYGTFPDVQEKLAASSFQKLTDKNIIDSIERNGRDPIRKLGPNDRLIGPARLVLEFGGKPKYLARSIAAALHYNEPRDPIAVTLKEVVAGGIDRALSDVCHISPNESLSGLIKEAICDLKNEGVLV